ncbi:hypothetical protein V2G26_000961 [Clonostachys chloroleuca]
MAGLRHAGVHHFGFGVPRRYLSLPHPHTSGKYPLDAQVRTASTGGKASKLLTTYLRLLRRRRKFDIRDPSGWAFLPCRPKMP